MTDKTQPIVGAAVYGPLHGVTFIGRPKDRHYDLAGERCHYRSYTFNFGDSELFFWVEAKMGDPRYWTREQQELAATLARHSVSIVPQAYLATVDSVDDMAKRFGVDAVLTAAMAGLLGR